MDREQRSAIALPSLFGNLRCLDVETRVVALLDLLGFRTLVQRHMTDGFFWAKLDAVLMIHGVIAGGRIPQTANLRARMFSDCICVSCPANGEDLQRLLSAIAGMQFSLTASGILVRGGIAVGSHVETPSMIASDALIAAYDIERTLAANPRVVLTDEVVMMASKGQDSNAPNSEEQGRNTSVPCGGSWIVVDASDGLHYVDYLGGSTMATGHGRPLETVKTHRDGLAKAMSEAQTGYRTPSITSKLQWAADYHNGVVDRLFPSAVGTALRIEVPGLR